MTFLRFPRRLRTSDSLGCHDNTADVSLLYERTYGLRRVRIVVRYKDALADGSVVEPESGLLDGCPIEGEHKGFTGSRDQGELDYL